MIALLTVCLFFPILVHALKRWQLFSLSQYHTSLIQPVKYKECHIFAVLKCAITLCLKVLERFCAFLGFRGLRTIGKCTNRHLFSYGGLHQQSARENCVRPPKFPRNISTIKLF